MNTYEKDEAIIQIFNTSFRVPYDATLLPNGDLLVEFKDKFIVPARHFKIHRGPMK